MAKLVRPYDLPISLVLVGGVVLAVAAPDVHYGLMQEDAWAEWSTFIAFVGAAGLAVALRATARRRLDKLAAVLLALFAVFVAGEEISWGHRVLAFEPPEIFLEHNYQQESNLHNLLKSVLDTRWMVAAIGAGYGVLLPVAVRLAPLRRFAPLAPSLRLAPWFIAVAILELWYPFPLTGELAELLLGLTFVADLGERHERLGGSSTAPTLVQAGSMVLALLVTPILEGLIYGDQVENVALVRAELEQLGADLRRDGALKKKILRKRRVHKRLYTAVTKRYVRFGKESRFLEGRPDRADRRGYFIDVWNQPYWVLYTRRDRRVMVYSFGPNRRRDLDAKKSDGGEVGDDVVVVLEIEESK